MTAAEKLLAGSVVLYSPEKLHSLSPLLPTSREGLVGKEVSKRLKARAINHEMNFLDLTKKKLAKLRKQGILPANIYGKDIKSMPVQVPYKEFEVVYKEVGSGLIDVSVNGAKG